MADEHFYVVVSYPIRLAGIENMNAGIILDSLIGLLERILFFFGSHTFVVSRCKMTSVVMLGYGELALKETDGMDEINLWFLIVVKFSE